MMASRAVLKDLRKGQQGKVVKVGGRGEVRRRILDMGVVPGTVITVEGVAPLGDPVAVKLKGYHLSLRKEEADKIVVETV